MNGANDATKDVTVDRISNNGNPVAAETHNGQAIHVPGREPGDRLLVRLEEAGGYYRATVVDRYETAVTTQTSTPSGPPSSGASSALLELGKKLCGDREISIEQRHSDSSLGPAEYPGKDKRKTIATRHD